MMGMEKMLASMLGITPEEMQATVQRMQTGFETFANTLVEVSRKQDLILEELEGLKNDRANNSNSNSGRKPKRITGSGDAGSGSD